MENAKTDFIILWDKIVNGEISGLDVDKMKPELRLQILLQIRDELGITQQEICQWLDVSREAYILWRALRHTIPAEKLYYLITLYKKILRYNVDCLITNLFSYDPIRYSNLIGKFIALAQKYPNNIDIYLLIERMFEEKDIDEEEYRIIQTNLFLFANALEEYRNFIS